MKCKKIVVGEIKHCQCTLGDKLPSLKVCYARHMISLLEPTAGPMLDSPCVLQQPLLGKLLDHVRTALGTKLF